MSLMVDAMHLLIVAAGVAIGAWALIALRRSLPRGRFLVFGAWALIALRRSLPRGRFLVFGAGASGALFGCAALSGEVGLVSPPAWFAIVMAALAAMAGVALKAGSAKAGTA